MRRPLPPELVQLGDRLESAAARALGRRRTRRALVLNAMASLVIAVPLVGSLLGTVAAPAVTPPAAFAPSAPAPVRTSDDSPPRVVRHIHKPVDGGLLPSPPGLHRVLR